MSFVELRGLRFWYERCGEGKPVLVFSGSNGDLRRKPGLRESPLSQTFDVLTHDQRGLGQSAKPDVPYTMQDYAEDGAALLDAIGWERCSVVGVSFGGMVAQEFAIRFPERLDRLVLACTSSGGAGGASYPLHALQDVPTEERSVRMLELSDIRYDREWRQANPRALAGLTALMSAAADPGASEPGRELGALRLMEARRGHDSFGRLGEITAPTFVCGGRFDGLAPPENLEALASAIPGASLEIFESGHMFLAQDRTAWPAIVAFLERS